MCGQSEHDQVGVQAVQYMGGVGVVAGLRPLGTVV